MLPPLREELTLLAGPVAPDGSPTWTLRDPVRNSFFRIGWAAFEILARWSAGSVAEIRRQVNEDTTLAIDEDEVFALLEFLSGNQLLRVAGPEESARLARIAQAQKQSWFQWLLHHYLFIRVPLVRPDRFLDRSVALVSRIFYTRRFLIATGFALAAGLFVIMRQWDGFRATAIDTLTPQGLIYYGLALSLVKTLHEFGHAYTAKRLGCRVPTMGVAFLVLWPVLYTDVNDSWRLPRRSQRLAVGVSGIAAELIIAAWSTILWGMLPSGPAREMAFVLAAVTWISSLLINLSPFMRFDGYFLLMDALEMPNLHQRAFALGRWWLREELFGLGEEPPERLGRTRQRLVVAFAFAVWLYRLALFVGIAALVYHFFIKIVGILLFAVEIGWFVALPIGHELAYWYGHRGRILGRRRARWSLIGAALLLLVLVLPWRGEVGAPAMLKQADSSGLYVPTAARLVALDVAQGQEVQAGAPLFRFESPDISQRQDVVRARIKTLDYELQSTAFNSDFREQTSVIRDQLAAAIAERDSLMAEAKQLTVTAPAGGRVVDVAPDLHAGDWISPKDRLAILLGTGGPEIDAYVGESDLGRVALGDMATFYPDAAARGAMPCRVTAIDRLATPVLTDIELASTRGGGIPVRGKDNMLVPDGAVYRVRLTPVDAATPQAQLRGYVRISGEGQSLIARTARSAAAVMLREWGM